MSAIEMVRDGKGQVSAVVEGDERRKVLRDTKGRIAGIEGSAAVQRSAEQLVEFSKTINRTLQDAIARMDGWQPLTSSTQVHEPSLHDLGARLGLTRSVDIRTMSSGEEAERDRLVKRPNHICGGFYTNDGEFVHRIVLRDNLDAATTQANLIHELVHAGQVDQSGAEAFYAAYAQDSERVERQADEATKILSQEITLVRERQQ